MASYLQRRGSRRRRPTRIRLDRISERSPSNGAGYRNAESISLFDEASRFADRDRRRASYVEIQRILASEVPYFWIIDSQALRSVSNGIHRLPAMDRRVFRNGETRYILIGAYLSNRRRPGTQRPRRPQRNTVFLCVLPPSPRLRRTAVASAEAVAASAFDRDFPWPMNHAELAANWFLRRLAAAIPVVAGVTVLTFTLIHLAPGDPIYLLAGDGGSPSYYAGYAREVRAGPVHFDTTGAVRARRRSGGLRLLVRVSVAGCARHPRTCTCNAPPRLLGAAPRNDRRLHRRRLVRDDAVPIRDGGGAGGRLGGNSRNRVLHWKRDVVILSAR